MYQQLTIVGNAGNGAVMRYLPDGTPVTTFSVAVNRRWKSKDGEQRESTTWHRCTAWNRLAEVCAEYIGKGTKLMVIGTVDTDAWLDSRTNEPRAQLEVRCETVRFLDSKPEGKTRQANGVPVPAGPDEGDRVAAEIPF